MKEAQRPTIISLGRLIQKGLKLEWTKNGAYLLLPNKKKVSVPVYNNCPYANGEVLKIVKNSVVLKRISGKLELTMRIHLTR